jgi:aminoglycoside phosphotransferase (APT) family kinase protein
MAKDAKEFKIDCPCCKAELFLDAETGGVLKAIPHKDEAPTLEQFMKSDKTRSADLAAKFDAAKKEEDGRLDMLNKKFEWAKKNKDKLPEAPKPGIMWD